MKLEYTSYENLVYYITLFTVLGYNDGCSRERSRVVRSVITEKIYPLYKSVQAEIPDTCILNKERDIYAIQEDQKYNEPPNKWYCNICGKGFMAEYYLDLHFTNRHKEYIRQGEDVICLADYCDLYRCDIIAGIQTAEFWDVSLCLEEDMEDIKQRCKEVFSNCVPKGLSKNATLTLEEGLNEIVCNFHTCKKYWETPLEKPRDVSVMYTVFTVFTFIILIIYYCIGYQYYYTDTFTDMYEPSFNPSYKLPNQQVRQRIVNTDR